MLIPFLNTEVVLITLKALEKFVLFLITSIQTSHHINQTSNQKAAVRIPEVGSQELHVYKVAPGFLVCREGWQPLVNIFVSLLHEFVK